MQQARQGDLFRGATFPGEPCALQQVGCRVEPMHEKVDQGRLRRHRREPGHFAAGPIGFRIEHIECMHHQPAGPTPIAAFVDKNFELGNGVIALTPSRGNRRIELFRHVIFERIGPLLMVHAFHQGFVTEAGSEFHLIYVHSFLRHCSCEAIRIYVGQGAVQPRRVAD
jgi:hypothetical protein